MAIGGFLGGLANLGAVAGGAQQYQLQDAHIRQALAQLAAEQRRQQLFDLQVKEQQKAQQQEALGWQTLLQGGNLFGQPQQGGGQGPDYSPGAVQRQPLAPQPGYLPSTQAINGVPSVDRLNQAFLRIESGNRDYPPDSRAGAIGPGQIMPSTAAGYGVGGAALRDPAVNRQLSRQITGDLYSQFGGNPDLVAIGYNAGPGRARQVASGAPISSLPAETQNYIAKLHRELDLPPEQQQQAQSVAVDTATAIPPQMVGRLSPQMLARAINNVAGPGVPDDVKMGALASLYKLLAPQGQQAFQQQWEMFKFAQTESDKAATREETRSRDRATEEYRRARLAGEGSGKQQPYGSVNDLMQRWHDDFVNQQGREPTTDEVAAHRAEVVKASKPISATQAGVVRRLEIGANDVAKSATAITSLPFGTTLGLFGGAQGAMGPGLVENIKKSLANAATPESAQVLRALTKGLGRGLAIIGSGGVAQGMVTLQKDLQELVPVANDTGLTIAGKFADMRQLFDAATEVMLADEQIPEEQHKLIRQMQEQVHAAIPFETQDVAKLVGDPSDEKLADFARKMGLGKQAGGAHSGLSDDDLKKALGLQ